MRIVSESVRWKLQYLPRNTIESLCTYDPFLVDIYIIYPDIYGTIMRIFWSCMFMWVRIANDLTKWSSTSTQHVPKYLHDCSRNVWIKQKISTRNMSYVHRNSIVSQGRYWNFNLTLSDTILIFCALFSVHTHFHYLGSQWYTFYQEL